MNNLTFFCLILIFGCLVVKQTSADPWQILIGIGLCFVIELIVLSLYCLHKAQKAYRDSNRINLYHNQRLNPQQDYKFHKPMMKNQFFLNKYSEEAKVVKKKSSLKFTSLDNYFQEQSLINQQPRVQTIKFLQQIKGYYKILNMFNNVFIGFGKSLFQLPKSIFGNKNLPSYLEDADILDFQRKTLEKFTNSEKKHKQNDSNYPLPNWQNIIICIQYIGSQFIKIQQIKNSNSLMLQMIHKRLLEDYQFIQKQIISLGRSIQEIRDNIQKLKTQREKIQGHQTITSSQPHNDMMMWFLKQIHQFKDMERRIKINQSQFKEQTQKLKYYKQKLSTFITQNKRKYLKILKTRFIAFLDSYYITIDLSTSELKKVLLSNHQFQQLNCPKVHKMPSSRNINIMVQAEKKYFEQESQRVNFHRQSLIDLWQSIKSMKKFLSEMKNIFEQFNKSMQQCINFDKQVQHFKKFFTTLSIESKRLLLAISLLGEINQKVQILNQNQVKKIVNTIDNYLNNIKSILLSLNISQVPLLHKYPIVREQLLVNYKGLQKQISLISQFKQHYIKHTNRIKKILLLELIHFLNFQRKYLNYGRISDKNYSDVDYDISDEKFNVQENKSQQQQDQSIEKAEDNLELDTGNYLSPVYVGLINRFIFAAYTEWKTSSFFKETISNELYIVFNLEPQEGLKQIEVHDMKIGGLPPEIVWIKQLRSEQNQFLADIKISFKGLLSLLIKTNYKLLRVNIPLEISFQVEQFYCVMRLCFVPSDVGKGWLSFIGEPISKFNVVPVIGNYRVDMKSVTRMFQNIVKRKMKEASFPIRQKLPIPLSKKDEDMEVIKKRLAQLAKHG